IGALVVQNSKKDDFSEEDVRYFRAISSQLATVIETARLLIGFNEKQGRQKEPDSLSHPKVIQGRVGSRGFAVAQAVVLDNLQPFAKFLAHAKDRSYSIDDFTQAVRKTEERLQALQQQIEQKLADVASLIFTAQILMLKDKAFVDTVAAGIRRGLPAPKAIVAVVEEYMKKFEDLPTAYLREKKHDVKDIGIKLLENLVGISDEENDLRGKIVIAEELLPSDILKLSSQDVRGVLLLSGGMTSHLSILARSLEIPVIISDARHLLKLAPSTMVLMDAEEGKIYVEPSETIVKAFAKKDDSRLSWKKACEAMKPATRTKDGTRVRLYANVNLLHDVQIAREYKCEGVGLYRTEFPFIVRSDFPSEEEQYVVYKKLVDGMGGKEIVFRTLDIGGDKVLSYYDYGHEENPFLGLRSIRFSLRHKDIFAQQLRAILRAGAGAEIRIMFPMISSLDELLEAKQVVRECAADLKKEGIVCHSTPPIGMMVELPAVLEIIDELAEESDFFSIGTNDFIQYMLAVDRTNEKVADFYLPHHPSILRSLKKIVDAAAKHGKDVSVCGDMAHDERYVPYFLGIGIRKFSLDPRFFPKIQKTVESTNLPEAVRQAQKLLGRDRVSDLNAVFERKAKAGS
ncbi:MAG: phosphoenolpyruvate--protein phosphotransferase, partial [Candidatus Omnitrophota bacterium]|nr:phosphoenolpyruvate--protein phosphotransferase [Candidatus Omnitrophota bacterium]